MAVSVVLSSVLMAGCRAAPSVGSTAIRLVELYDQTDLVGQTSPPPRDLPRTEWRFDAPPAPAWKAGPGVAAAGVKQGRLAATSTTDFPLLHLERTADLDNKDLVHAVEVRLRVSAGSNLAVRTGSAEKVDLAEVLDEARALPWLDTTPLLPGDEMRTYTLRLRRSPRGPRHLFIRPTDAPGARFEIESVRMIFRKEHLASVASGIGWQGLADVYQETIVARSPETIQMSLALPARPWLDLSIGTIEDGPVTFEVGVGNEPLARRTVTTPHRWESVPLDLSGHAGQTVALRLSLSAEAPGALGFWGSPVVRQRMTSRPGETQRAAASSARPNGIILIWADTLRSDHLDVYGYKRETAPVIRRMAQEGTRFSDCLVNATWTKVSTPSLMTSLYPLSHGVKEFADRLPASATTLAEVYRDAGYATLSMSSVLFTGRFTNLHQGFEVLHEDTSLSDQASSKTAREYVDRLLPWIEEHRDVPFFVLLHVTDPHDPYKPYPPYDTMWADGSKAEHHEKQLDQVRKVITEPLLKLFGMPTREELVRAGIDPVEFVSYDRDWYDGSIRGMDAEIGRLLERLAGLGIDKDALVVFTGDHGEEFHEHGRMFHGQSVYGELTNVPLIFWRPGSVPAGVVVDQTVQVVDLMPTLLEMSGLAAPEGMQGRSLAPLVSPGEDGAGASQTVSAFASKAATGESANSPPPHGTEAFTIVKDGWKLVRHTKRLAGDSGAEFELFDHRRDPLNMTDVAAAHPEIVAALAGELEAWRTRARAARLPADAQQAGSMSAEELERLRSLGYIQ